MTRIALFLSLAALSAAGAARADEVVATAGPTGAPPTSTAAQVDAFIHKAPPVNLDDGTPEGVTPQEEPRRIHGEVGASIGTGGYRSGYAMSTIPVGKTGTLAIAVSETRFGRNGGPGWSGGFAPYGSRQSLGLGLAFGDAAQSPCHGQGFDPYSPVLPLEGERPVCRAPLAGR
jgi:hypothetical protein